MTSLVYNLMDLLFENNIDSNDFNPNNLKNLTERFDLDYKILTFFKSLIKNNKPMKTLFKDSDKLNFFNDSTFKDKITKLNEMIKSKILSISGGDTFQSLINKFTFKFIVQFYVFLSTIIEFCFYLLNEDDSEIKSPENELEENLNCLKDLMGNVSELIKNVQYINNAMVIKSANDKDKLDKIVPSFEALNRYLEGQSGDFNI